ncbi:spore germination protein [Paenibacillus sp. Marseille-Q4541]|uniref:spore germination protein n=1 Tax=Paenibacillus sp. Marseille-Q4541 TaxID=2831522 RepID=UPI001BA8CD74|nr:spore germination protein [Paenibacillus sp. Marseille-Q4541]
MNQDIFKVVKEHLNACPDVIYKSFIIHERSCALIYIQSIVDNDTLQKYISSPLLLEGSSDRNWEQFCKRLDQGLTFSVPYQSTSDAKEASDLVVQGKAVLYIEGISAFYYFDTTQYQKRSISESQNELVVTGPQEAFIEDIQSNLSLIRHKIKHPDLKMKEYMIGDYTKTSVYVIYIDGLQKPEILHQIEEQLQNISVDGIFGISYLVEHFKEKSSPFPIFQDTERPDAVAASLLEGRIGVLMDGTPTAIIAPVTFFSLLQSAEDYYQNYYAASWIRLVRIFFTIVSVLLPSMYVAVTTFHPQVIPTSMLITIAAARENIPFSALTEAIIMELTFEALREAGTRIPKPVGQTVSIIGAIVIGQAAVLAGIVSAPMVIVVSITGIASYIIPHLELGLILRLLRFPLLILGGTMGLLGVFVGTFVIYGHLVSLKSFGTPYMQPVAPLVLSDWKDTFLRVPTPLMKNRSTAFSKIRNRRSSSKP